MRGYLAQPPSGGQAAVGLVTTSTAVEPAIRRHRPAPAIDNFVAFAPGRAVSGRRLPGRRRQGPTLFQRSKFAIRARTSSRPPLSSGLPRKQRKPARRFCGRRRHGQFLATALPDLAAGVAVYAALRMSRGLAQDPAAVILSAETASSSTRLAGV